MCRLFGAISSTKMDATYLLVGAPQSLLVQSDIDKKHKQGDGWGIGWFASGHPHILKNPRPMFRDKPGVTRASKRASGNVLVGHVRWASNPLKLKRRELIGPVHTQPFVHGNWIFAHNGTLFIPREVAAELGSWKKFIEGKNDSEVLFYWLLKHGVQKGTPQALRRALGGLHRIWAACRKSYPIHAHPYHGLNWVLTDGRILIAFCYTDPRGFGKSKALCDRKQCYYLLHRKVTGQEVLVASEPLDKQSGWEGFRHGELLVIRRRTTTIKTRTFKVL